METYWVPGVSHHGQYGRWAFAEITDVYEMQDDFAAKVETAFNAMIDGALGKRPESAR
jgi:type III restriction enzyme